MNKKITKTIMTLIVFVVFLGLINLDDVYATRSYCRYSLDDADFVMVINNEGGLAEYSFVDIRGYQDVDHWYEQIIVNRGDILNYMWKNQGNIEIRNWGAKYVGFSGASYYVNNSKKCPPSIFYVEDLTSHLLVFSDGTNEYMNDVMNQLDNEDYTWDKNDLTGSAHSFANYLEIGLINKVGSLWNWVDNKVNGTDYEWEDVDLHIVVEFPLTDQHDVEEPDPVEETVIDDGHEREWIDPSVRPVNPLDQENVTYSCGDGMLTGLSSRIPKFGKFLYNFMQFLIPISLVLLGTIDLIKAIVGSKEDDIKKNQSIFIKRLIGAAVVFFSFAFVKLILSIVAEDSAHIIQCVDCVLRNSSSCIEEN